MNVLIVAPSGCGKSTSIENLDSESTIILNCESKDMPFRKKFPKHAFINSFAMFNKSMEQALKLSEVKTIVIDSLSALQELVMVECQRTKKGFDIFSSFNSTIQDVLLKSKEVRDKNIIFLTLAEQVLDDAGNSVIKARMEGKKLSNSYVESCFTMVLHGHTKKGEDGQIRYEFITNNDGVRLAKTPRGMFEDLYIPNDLALVVSAIENYYKD